MLPRFRLFGMLIAVAGLFAVGLAADGQSGPVGPPAGMGQAIALLTEARQTFQSVRDYECRLVKRERVKGVLLPEGVLTMKVRNDPFSVYLRVESPAADQGMEVSYVKGRNDGMMRVHPPHLMGALGFWSVATDDPRALEKNRHSITEAGLGTLLENTARYWGTEHGLGKTVVHITDDTLAGRPCTRIETLHPDRTAGSFYGYRCVLWLDQATHLPAGAETYDWPREGHLKPELLESYRYLDLRCNVGVTDKVFSH
jgi:hypothetical protein